MPGLATMTMAPKPGIGAAAGAPRASGGVMAPRVGSGQSRPMGPTQIPSGGGGNQQLTTAITNMLSPAAQIPAINNTAAPNPQAQQANNMLMERAQGDMGAADAMRLSGIANADQAAMNMADARGGASRRGVGNSSVGNLLSSKIASDAQRAQAGENSKIAFGSERAKDAQLTNVRGGALDQQAAAQNERRLANDQYQTATNAALSQQRLQQEKLNSVLGLLGPGGFGQGGFF